MRSENRDLAPRERVRSGRGRGRSQKGQTPKRNLDLRRALEKLVPEPGTRRRAIERLPLLFVHLEDIDSSRGELVSKPAQSAEREYDLGVEGLGESHQELGCAHSPGQSGDLQKDGASPRAIENAPTGEKQGKAKPRCVESAERLDALERPVAFGPPEARRRARRSEKRKAEIGGDDDDFRSESFELSRDLVQEPAPRSALSARDEHRRGALEDTIGERRHGVGFR
jgi:hypothetical protein